jgi:hypothetical protein
MSADLNKKMVSCTIIRTKRMLAVDLTVKIDALRRPRETFKRGKGVGD